jgi:hypothetical protein
LDWLFSSSGPWHLKHVLESIGRTSRLNSTFAGIPAAETNAAVDTNNDKPPVRTGANRGKGKREGKNAMRGKNT